MSKAKVVKLNMPEVVSTSQAAKILGPLKGKETIHQNYILRMIQTEKLQAETDVHGYKVIKKADLEKFVNEYFLKPQPRGRNARKLREAASEE